MNKKILHFFKEISAIPRCSGNEQAISDFLLAHGRKLNLESFQDEHHNILIRKPATAGYQNSPGVILQGHMDMVCEKTEASLHNFDQDPIRVIEEDGFIHAADTTLGADNGIAIAMGLAILADPNLSHPSLELLITTGEEVNMGGALGLSTNLLRGRYLLNLDSEEEGLFVAGSAGGERIVLELPCHFQPPPKGFTAFSLTVSGLQGGHSGIEIHKNRTNAIQLLGQCLSQLLQNRLFFFQYLQGGSKDNAIPRQALCEFLVEESALSGIRNSFQSFIQEQGHNLNQLEPDWKVNLTPIPAKQALDNQCSQQLLSLLTDLPSGPHSYMQDYPQIVESSCNLAIVTTQANHIRFHISARSACPDKATAIRKHIQHIAQQYGADFLLSNQYPAWEYRPHSPLRNLAVKVYQEQTGEIPEITILHAGLECGVLSEKYPGLDILSYGPNLYDVHTPKERLDLASTQRVYQFTCQLLTAMK